MSTEKDYQPPQLRTFEVQLDANNPDHALVLQGLTGFLQAHQIPLQETTAIEEDVTPIPKEHILGVSQELFGSDVYGKNALTLIGAFESTYCGTAMESAAGRIVLPYQPKHQPYSATLQQVQRASRDSSPASIDLQRSTHNLLAESRPPFTIRTQRVSENSVSYAPGAITQETLHAFMEERRLQEHTLHGAIGKTLNVLLQAAGLSALQEVLDVPELDFITSDELHRRIHEQLPHPDVRKNLLNKISQALQEQLVTGKPTGKSEVITEGRFTLIAPSDSGSSGSWTMQYDRIARQTLMAIADGYNRKTDATELLAHLATG